MVGITLKASTTSKQRLRSFILVTIDLSYTTSYSYNAYVITDDRQTDAILYYKRHILRTVG